MQDAHKEGMLLSLHLKATIHTHVYLCIFIHICKLICIHNIHISIYILYVPIDAGGMLLSLHLKATMMKISDL